jgi:hypothetical protein
MMPMLYSWIQLIPSQSNFGQGFPSRRVLIRFFRTMNTAPDLKRYIKGLNMSIKHFSRIKTVSDFGTLDCTRLRKVELAVETSWSMWEWRACCENLRNLLFLAELSIDLGSQGYGGFDVFLTILGQLPSLAKLVLDGVREDQAHHGMPVLTNDHDEDRTVSEKPQEIDQEASPSQVCKEISYVPKFNLILKSRARAGLHPSLSSSCCPLAMEAQSGFKNSYR